MNAVKSLLVISLYKGLEMLGEEVAHTAPKDNKLVELEGLSIDLRAHEVCRDGQPIALTPSEFRVLVAMATHMGEAVDYVTLAEDSLGYKVDAQEAKELIKRHIFALRSKIGPDFETPQYILNVRGVGYRLVEPDFARNL